MAESLRKASTSHQLEQQPPDRSAPGPKSPQMAGKKSVLTSLYDLTEIEMAYVLSRVIGADVFVDVGDDVKRDVHLPAGDYLLVKLTHPLLPRPGIFAKPAPKTEE